MPSMNRPTRLSAVAKRVAHGVLAPTKRPIAMALRTVLETVAADTTESRKSCLVLAPHPDDETLGCGATIMHRLAAGVAVHVVVVSDGAGSPPGRERDHNRRVRSRELHSACGVLGLDPEAVVQWKFADGSLASAGDDLVEAIIEAVGACGPAEVLVTSAHDPHGDHAALGRAARKALAGTSTRLLTYPIWQWDRPGHLIRTARDAGRPESVDTDGVLARKARAVAVYASQLAAPEATGQDDGLTPAFIGQFLRTKELFFPVSNN